MKIEYYKSGVINKSWKWRLISDNGRIMASGRGFNRIYEAKDSVKKIKEFFKNNMNED